MARKDSPNFTPFKVPGMKQSRRNGIEYVEAHAVKCGGILRDLATRVAYDFDPKWTGATQAGCQEMLDKGSEEQVKRARKFAKQVEREVPVATSAQVMTNVVAGGAVSVGRYLAGNPVCFTRPAFDDSSSNPVRIFVDIGCSSGVSQKDVETRGLAILAFAFVLSKSRPVELIAFEYANVGGRLKQDVVVQVSFGLRPVNWGMAGAIIGHSAFLRNTSFRMAYAAVGGESVRNVDWGSKYVYGRMSEESKRAVLGTTDKDIVFDGGHLTDSLLLSSPVEWVKQELVKVTERLAK